LKPGRPTKDTPFEVSYQLSGELTRLPEVLKKLRVRSGRFIVATNVLDGSLSADEVLAEYKDQQVVERGFRFLRDPFFFTSSVFLKTPARVAALAMIMALSLLVYTLGQRLVRVNLAAHDGSVADQKGKPTTRPTLRWIFQVFMAVHLLRVAGQLHIVNLNSERKRVLEYFSPACRKYYLLP
jgi:transposase